MKGHWRRLFVQIGIFLSMIIVNLISADLYVGIVSLSLLVLLVASWTVFGILLWTSKQAPDIQSLSDRVDDALSLAIAATAAAVLGLVVILRFFKLIDSIGSWTTVFLGFIVVQVSIPALGYLKTWRETYLPLALSIRDHQDTDTETTPRDRGANIENASE